MSHAGHPPVPRCRVELGGSSSALHNETVSLLHARLFTVAVLAFVPFLLFLLRNLIDPGTHGPSHVILQACTTGFLGGMVALLWPRRAWSECGLRKVELALLAAMGGYFCWLQLGLYRDPDGFHARGAELVRLWIDASAVRWFFLIVLYGVFIPGHWQRCLAIALTLAVLPVVLTGLGAFGYGCACVGVWHGMFDLAILLGTGVGVAVFGSYRLEALRREAFTARQLGQYTLGRQIGKGGMGEVYEAEHKLLRRRCAVKLIRPDKQLDPQVRERFEREVQAMATLTHPNSAAVYDYGHADDGTFYYVMEYLPGMTLEQVVSKYGAMPAARVIHLMRQVCRALHEAHGIGLLHRDIKPGNIIASERGGEHDVAKLLDYGLVQSSAMVAGAEKLTLQGMVLGSPPFMAPEQAQGRAGIDPRADIYALGGVAYYLLSGHAPFERETAMEMLLAHAYESPAPLSSLCPDVPRDLEAVVMRCLEKKPEDRFADALTVERALASCDAAGEWDEAHAAGWWSAHSVPQDTAEHLIPTVATPRVAAG
jgi:serine/threonine-protein kinase